MKKILIVLAACMALLCAVLTLSACSGETDYSVACQDCENGYVTVAQSKVEAGERVILAAHPNAGYMLSAFVVDGDIIDGCSFVMPQKDVTVSARFEVVTYSITYIPGDATVSGNNPDTYTVESVTELAAPQKDGYEVCGWYRYYTQTEYGFDIEEFRVISLEGLVGNLTLYAKYYNPPHVIIITDDEHGDCYIENYDYEAYYGQTYNVVVEPDIGYYFDGLLVNGIEVDGTTFAMPAGGAEITPIFKPVVYEISYELDGGENADDNPVSFTVEDGYLHLNDPTKDGYMFVCWYTDEEMTNCVYGDLNVYDCIEQPLTLYAYFVKEYEGDE